MSVFRFIYGSTAYRLICRPIVLVGMIIRRLIDRQANDSLVDSSSVAILSLFFEGF